MAEASRVPDAKPRIPRWVKVMAIIAIVIAVLVVVVMKLSGGQHGPGRHLPGGSSAPQSAGVVEDGGYTQPAGIDRTG
jgi:hypothetical protein